MIRDDDDFVPIPNFGVFAKFALEYANGPWSANVVRHQNICVYPYVIACLYVCFASRAGEDFFGQRHNCKFTSRVPGISALDRGESSRASINTGLYGSIQLSSEAILTRKKARRGTQQIRAQVF